MAGGLDGCRRYSVCEYGILFLELDTLIFVMIGVKKNKEIFNMVLIIFMFYYVGVVKVHKAEMD